MLFSNSVDNLPGDIIFDNSILEKINSTKFLGLIIDDKLSWKLHIDSICKTISRNIGVINKLKYFFPTPTIFMLYSTLILPYMNYGILAWGNATKHLLDRLLLLQKKIIRIACNAGFHTHTTPLFYEKKILKVQELYKYHLGQFMHKYSKNELPHIFSDMFIRNNTVHNYPTRLSKSLHLPLTRTLFANRIFTFTGPKLWNSLDESMKQPQSLPTFKHKLKTMLLNNYAN